MTKKRVAYALAACFSTQAAPLPKAEAAGRCSIRTVGEASYYGPGFQGNPTANGERFNMHGAENTAAHPTLPFNSRVRVIDLETGRRIVVRINDRGPHADGRIIDLQMATAQRLGLTRQRGVADVRLEVLRCGA